MISLSHLQSCSSLISPPKMEGELSFFTDTRAYQHPGAFVAIPGVKVNPLDIISPLLEKNCPLIIFQDDPINREKVSALKERFPQTTFLAATDSVTFLQELTSFHIRDWKAQSAEHFVFAISGSNGKTTHKEMLSFLLKEVMPGKVVATEKNNNNHLGVPLTLLNVSRQTEIVVLELGSNHPGEIKVLCDISAPNAGVTTNIGATHLEFFGTEDSVFKEEAYLYHAVKEQSSGQGLYLINQDDKFLSTLLPFEGAVTYGETNASMAKVSFLDDGATISYRGETFTAQNSFITGKHNKLNLVTCLFIASQLFPKNKSKFVEACKKFRPTKNRSEWIEFDSASVYLDAYNANPSSMKAALEGFRESVLARGYSLDEACIVLGDMNELGEATPQYHEETGKFVRDLGFKHVFFIGRFSHHYLAGNPLAQARRSSAEFKSEYRNDCVSKFPIHFIKGSRSLQLESLFDIT